MTEWKPGDVALVTTVHGWTGVAIFTNRDLWHNFDGYWGEHEVADLRPLVVIDPEDCEGVERLADVIIAEARGHRVDKAIITVGLHNALREVANPKPAKPPEPQGLGAVVEDAEGIRWTRVQYRHDALTRNPWYPADHSDEQPAEWHEFDAVKVLSEGV